jgi:hypothetical protein
MPLQGRNGGEGAQRQNEPRCHTGINDWKLDDAKRHGTEQVDLAMML